MKGKAKAELSPEEIEDYKEAFDNFDKNKDGDIDISELGIVMRSLGYSPTEKQLRDMLEQVDTDGNGVITFNEFVDMMRKCELSTDFEAEVKEAFAFFDKNNDGGISPDELAEIMRGLGSNLTDQEIDLLVKEADSNKDGTIDVNEFINLMYS